MELTYAELAILFKSYRGRIHEITEGGGFSDQTLLVNTIQAHVDRMREITAQMKSVQP